MNGETVSHHLSPIQTTLRPGQLNQLDFFSPKILRAKLRTFIYQRQINKLILPKLQKASNGPSNSKTYGEKMSSIGLMV